MATTVHEPPKIDLDRLPSQGSGNGGWRNLGPAGGDLRRVKPSSPPPASTGIWVGLAAITMTFAAFTSALIVRQGSAPDWQHFTLPSILYLNSLIIIASSVTLEISRRQIAAFMGSAKLTQGPAPSRWLYVTLGSRTSLRRRPDCSPGCSSDPRDSGSPPISATPSFYVLTVAHAIHLLGGLGGLVRVIGKLNHSVLRRSTLNATSLYWHFMGALWLYLLLLLWMKL